MSQLENENQIIYNYSGIFLSCFAEDTTKCIHSTPEHVLVYLYSGEQIIEDRDRTIKLKAGECAFIRRDHRLKMYKCGDGENQYKGISLTFRRSILRDFYSKINKSEIPQNTNLSDKSVFRIIPDAPIKSLFESLNPYFDSNVKPTETITEMKLLEGIYALLNNNEQFYPILFDFAEPWKVDILEFLNENYQDDLSLEQIASFTGRSLATFKRDFKKVSPLTPQKWIMKKRLEMAYIKLKEDAKKVHEVYLEVGFKNPSHFSTAFKKQYGISPTEI
jgi:AraC family transcriptional regulator, exoenzyme S synthesis regulatory protein ExsA